MLSERNLPVVICCIQNKILMTNVTEINGTEANPIQLSSADAIVLTGCELHPVHLPWGYIVAESALESCI